MAITIETIKKHLVAYHEAKRILASNGTTVAERKSAIAVRDEFLHMAPAYVDRLVTPTEVQ
jgi:hypothetical protein